MKTICLLPRLEGLGGPASFHARFSACLRARGIEVDNDPLSPSCTAVLVIGGTRHLDLLWQARRRGVRLVQRLDGMNWIHRKRRTGLMHFLRAEANNLILANIRRYLADAIVYQSRYVQDQWQATFGTVRASSHLIYNSVNLKEFNPQGPGQRPEDHIRLLVVEGRLKGGHEIGLENAIRLATSLDESTAQRVELMVVADVAPQLQAYWKRQTELWITWGGVQPRENIPEIDRSAHLFFSAEVNAPCPNSVIEALACGLPVIAFATGSLPELVQGDAGRLAPYGSGYVKLGAPDTPTLVAAAQEVLADQERFRRGARAHAEAAFDIEKMVDRYLEVLL